MKALIICPADRAPVAFLAQQRPLALIPFLGRSLLDLWLAELATRGASQVVILAADRPDLIRRAVQSGEAWGLSIEVVPAMNESTIEDARTRHLANARTLPPPYDAIVLDRLPPAGNPVWGSCADWLATLRALAPRAAAERVGIRELSPGIAIHVRARISPSAHLEAPCWIGPHAWIGSRTRIGPNTIIEESAYIDDGAEVANSLVGPTTYVGALTEVRDSIAWGRHLLRWTTGSHVEIVDDFLLSDLGTRIRTTRATSPIGRLAALAALFLTCPILAIAWLRRRPGQPLLQRLTCIRAPNTHLEFAGTLVHHRLATLPEPWSRWPALWNIARGEFGWIGNPPIPPAEAASFRSEFERLWLAVPTGFITLADAEGCPTPYGDDARAHASYYAVSRNWRTHMSILRRVLARIL
jgi:hypothetical protein